MLNFLHRGLWRDNEGRRGFQRFPLQGGPWKKQVSVRTSDGSCPSHGPSMRSLCHLAASLRVIFSQTPQPWNKSPHRAWLHSSPCMKVCPHRAVLPLQPAGSEGLLFPHAAFPSHIWVTVGSWGSPPPPSLWTWEGVYLPSNCRPASVWLNQRTLLADHWTTPLPSHGPLPSLSFCGYPPSAFFLIVYCGYSSFLYC